MQEKKMNGLGCVESGSQSYLSGLLGFDEFEREDYDNNTEDDLRALGIESGDYELEIDQFFKSQAKDSEFWILVAQLDAQAQKYIKNLLA